MKVHVVRTIARLCGSRRLVATAGVFGLVVAGLVVGAPEARAAEPGTVTFGYVDPGPGDPVQTWVVPAGVRRLWVEAVGASGQDGTSARQSDRQGLGGLGGVASAAVDVDPGETLEIRIGGAGTRSTGGFNGGGGGRSAQADYSGGGGGATDLRQGGSGLGARVVVGGGGGGGGTAGLFGVGGPLTLMYGLDGGGGGGHTGINAVDSEFVMSAAPGTQTAGGTASVGGPNVIISPTSGVEGGGGNGGAATDTSNIAGGGGGGGGWYGGAGGSATLVNSGAAGYGGGGGSGHGPSGTVFGLAPERGNGSLTIAYDPTVGSCSGSGGTVVADHRFLNSAASSAGALAPVAPVGDGVNAFAAESVDGATRAVLGFPAGNGVDLGGLSSEFAHRAYTIVVLFRLDAVDGFRRLGNFAGDERDTGLYVDDGHLVFFGRDEQPVGPTTIAPGQWVQVALTRTVAGDLRGYVDGEEQFVLADAAGDAVINDADTLRFFRDDGRGEESSGAVARIRLFNGPLNLSHVAALDRLPAPAKVTRSRSAAPQRATVGVSLRRFGPGEQVRVRLRDARGRNWVLGTPTVTQSGQANLSAVIPAGAADGAAHLLTRGLTSGLKATISFQVT